MERENKLKSETQLVQKMPSTRGGEKKLLFFSPGLPSSFIKTHVSSGKEGRKRERTSNSNKFELDLFFKKTLL